MLFQHPAKLADFHVADSNRMAPGMGHLDWPLIVEQVRSFGVVAGLPTKRAELAPEVDPESYAQDKTSTTEVVKRDSLPGDFPWSTTWKRGDEWPKPDCRSPRLLHRD